MSTGQSACSAICIVTAGFVGSEGRDWMEWFVIDFFISIGPPFFSLDL